MPGLPATDFWQTQPAAGEAASERTEVYIVNTASTLFFGIVCHDRDPGSPSGLEVQPPVRCSQVESAGYSSRVCMGMPG